MMNKYAIKIMDLIANDDLDQDLLFLDLLTLIPEPAMKDFYDRVLGHPIDELQN